MGQAPSKEERVAIARAKNESNPVVLQLSGDILNVLWGMLTTREKLMFSATCKQFFEAAQSMFSEQEYDVHISKACKLHCESLVNLKSVFHNICDTDLSNLNLGIPVPIYQSRRNYHAIIPLLWIVHLGNKIQNVEHHFSSTVGFAFYKKMESFEAIGELKYMANVSKWNHVNKNLVKNLSNDDLVRTVIKVGTCLHIVIRQSVEGIVTLNISDKDGNTLSMSGWIQFFQELVKK